MNNLIFIALIMAALSLAVSMSLLIIFCELRKDIRKIGFTYDGLLKAAENQERLSANEAEILKDIWESYRDMQEKYGTIIFQHGHLSEQYKHIAESFKCCEERYSDIYDQWSEMTARFEEIGTKIDELKPPKEFFNTDAEESLEVREINSCYKEGA